MAAERGEARAHGARASVDRPPLSRDTLALAVGTPGVELCGSVALFGALDQFFKRLRRSVLCLRRAGAAPARASAPTRQAPAPPPTPGTATSSRRRKLSLLELAQELGNVWVGLGLHDLPFLPLVHT